MLRHTSWAIVVSTSLVVACGGDDESGTPTGGTTVTTDGGTGGAATGVGGSGGTGGTATGSGGLGGQGGTTSQGGGAVGELCPDPLPASWIFCDDFESSDPVADRYFEFGDDDGDFARVATESMSGSHSMETIFQASEVGAGGMKVTFGHNPIGTQYRTSEDFDDIYWRMYLKNQAGWTGSPAKLSRATVFAASDWSQAMIAHLWSSDDVLLGDPAGCVSGGSVQCSGYNDFANLQWLGQMPGTTPIFSTAASGVWRCIEGHARLNTPGSADGVFEFWIDGQLQNQRTDLDWRGTYTAYGINAVFFENYWNSGSPVEQRRYFDDIVIATEQIGCFGD